MANTAVIQLHHREAFETNVTRAVVGGAAAGLLYYASIKLNAMVTLNYLALAAMALACVRGTRREKVVLGLMALVLPATPWLFGMSNGWTIATAGAIAGLIGVKARVTERGPEGSVGVMRPTLFHYATTAALTGVMAVAGSEVARVLLARMHDLSTPAPLAAAVAGMVIALFASLGPIASHIALKSDPVEARAEEIMPQLSLEFQTLTLKALTLYRQCGESLGALPREAAREELARTVQKLTKDAVDLAAEWSGVEAQLHDDAHLRLQDEVADLIASARVAKDPVAKKQLELAAESLNEELARLDELKLKRERIVAKLKSQVALLERARVALIGMRSSHTSIRAAEMSAVARKLNALALSQSDEAKLAHAVATSSELAALESTQQEVALRQRLEAPVDEAVSGEGPSTHDPSQALKSRA